MIYLQHYDIKTKVRKSRLHSKAGVTEPTLFCGNNLDKWCF